MTNETKYIIPPDYRPLFGIREIETAIKLTKDCFETFLAEELSLQRVTAPLFLRKSTGLNDDLNGIEKPVSFRASGIGIDAEIVQSLAKWKRLALKRYGFKPGEGLYTDMNAIRADETVDPIHSLYVDQWDWEKIIESKNRTPETLKTTVERIYAALLKTERHLSEAFPALTSLRLPEKISFFTSDELYSAFPDKNPKEREAEFTRQHGAIFVIGIGGTLPDGSIHDGRAPDYDDWSTPRSDGGMGLNGDILVWHEPLGIPLELSSMGIRVDPESLRRQLEIRNAMSRAELPFHKALLAGELPQTLGGGIGQSRLCMYFLRTAHVGEVACGLWPDDVIEAYLKNGITLL